MKNRVVINGLNKKDNENVSMCENGEFINILPKNESQVDSLFNTMTHGATNQYILTLYRIKLIKCLE